MASKYQEQHYEDVARILAGYSDASLKWDDGEYGTVTTLVDDFANLFAADSPRMCQHCGHHEGNTADPWPECEPHDYTASTGFDRERFLKACGLEGD